MRETLLRTRFSFVSVWVVLLVTLSARAQWNDDGQWPMATKDYANQRYSSLDQINTDNAKNLKLAWTFSTGVFRGQEAAPLVVGDTMYLITPFPTYLYALDLKNPGTV